MTYLLDLLSVFLFVAVGRHAHSHGLTLKGMVSTTWPFGIGLLAGWIYLRLAKRNAASMPSGFAVVLFTVVIGMILRVISGQGTAFTFIVVALSFLSLFLVGWRWIYSKSRRETRFKNGI
jgi:ABC-type uncharacterized transport system permease subunit